MYNQDYREAAMQDYFTYDSGRECLHCGEAIPDQVHKSRLFCPREELPDGSIKNCKDDFWADLRSAEKNIDNQQIEYHKKIRATLAYLFDLNLPVLTYDTLDNTGIRLDYCLHFAPDEKGTMFFYFNEYAITVDPINDNLKLIKNERELF